MPIFSDSPQSLNQDFGAIKAKKDNDYRNNEPIWNSFWVRANQRVRLEAGDPTIMNTWGNNPGSLSGMSYYINRSRPIGLTISGYQIENRKSSIVNPLENGAQITSDQLTKTVMGVFRRERVYELISEVFHQGPIISGMSAIEPYLDFTHDPLNGDIKFKHHYFNKIMIDPYFEDPSGKDASFIMTRDYLPKPTVAHIMPERFYDDIMGLQADVSGSTMDGRFQYQAAARGYSMAPKLAYDNYWYRDYREQKTIYDLESGERMDINQQVDDEDLKIKLLEYPNLRLRKKLVPTVRLCIEIQNRVFYDGANPLALDEYPHSLFIGYHNKTMPTMYDRIQSVMSSLISPQLLFNRRIILNADFLESVVNTGWMFDQSAVIDPKHLLQTGQGKLIPLKTGALPLQSVAPIPSPNIHPSYFQQLELYDENLFNTIGMSQENVGKVVDDNSSGYKAALRTKAGWISQQPLFSRLDAAQNYLADRVVEIIQRNWTPAKVKQFLGEDQSPTAEFYDRQFGEYQCTTELGFNTQTQRELEFAQAMELRKLGVPIPDSFMVEKATLQGKTDLIKAMEAQAQQAQQMQQMQMQVQMQQLQSQARMSEAKAMADIGLYEERSSRVAENKALAIERLHEANKDDASAALDMIKAIKELQSIDITHIKELLGMANMIKSQAVVASEQEAQAATKQDTQQSGNGSRP